ncbi:right-handed parallel beta-helix repeat-containing protein [Prosthecobacter sp.]|uniref:right-handed parallel beta-helix repeat-containing protein n=1 Tax=Prosthecobacter sp. TaxID=1965333 RepID=UPI003782DD7E
MHRLALFLSLAFATHAQEIRHTPLTLKDGGTPDKPAVFDGKGMIIDLGIDVTSHDWEKQGDVWTSRGPFEKHPPIDDVQRAALFIEEVPIRITRDRAAEKASGEKGKVVFTAPSALQPGQMGFKPDGTIYFRWPEGKPPGSAKIFLPPAGLASCVNIACSYITIKNITALHAANDGFNIHGPRVGIRLENVKAFSNGDEGISAHETVQMDVFDSEIAWNGSSAGGIADVNDSVTTYTNCEVHHNVAAGFFLEGKSHRVTRCRIHHQAQDIVIRDGAQVEQSGNEWLKP